jgi:hypothetical protein
MHKCRQMLRNAIVCLWSGLCVVALAQESVPHRLRLLAVGDPPPFVQEVRDGARYEVPPAEGAVPPREVMVPVAAKSGDPSDSTRTPLRLRLGQPSNSVELPLPGNLRVDLESKQGAKWLGVPLLPCGASLALVWRGGRDWNEARTLVVPDDSQARMEGNVHFTNLTASPMAVVIGGEKIRLDPGKSFTRQQAPGSAAIPLEIFYPTSAGALRLCHSASLESSRGNFRRLVIYAADGKKPRMPVKVLQLDEPC